MRDWDNDEIWRGLRDAALFDSAAFVIILSLNLPVRDNREKHVVSPAFREKTR